MWSCPLPKTVASTFGAVGGQVQIGPSMAMPEAKWTWLMRSTSSGKLCLDLGQLLWDPAEATVQGLMRQAFCSVARTIEKTTATPLEAGVVKSL